MKYLVDPWVFEQNPKVCFSIIVGKNLKNTETSLDDSAILKASETNLKNTITLDMLKTHPDMTIYRDALTNVNINPNKYMSSIEAMSKRVIKGGSLPRINAMVDLCNAISLKEMISLGAHDLRDIKYDLKVRLTKEGDKFLPFGASEFESIPSGELVFASGHEIQTRQWLWRQSELGKITINSKDVLFQLVGFDGPHKLKFDNAIAAIETLITSRFGGVYKVYKVTAESPSVNLNV